MERFKNTTIFLAKFVVIAAAVCAVCFTAQYSLSNAAKAFGVAHAQVGTSSGQ